MRIRTWLLPELISKGDLTGVSVVVIDAVRASTTIATALAAGAEAVVPFVSIEGARKESSDVEAKVLLGGERGGIRVDGFDLGNSPAEYVNSVVQDRLIYFTTTNGTKALACCEGAAKIVIGSFINRQAIVQQLANSDSIGLVCAGTEGHVTREDTLAAGAIVAGLLQQAQEAEVDDSSRLALAAWQRAIGDSADPPSVRLARELELTQGGRNLIKIGQASDLERVAQVDQLDVVPVLVAGRLQRSDSQ